MFDAQLKVGRLVEIRVTGEITIPEVTAFRSQYMGILARLVGPVVICTDWRGSKRFNDELHAMLLGVMRSDNPRVERSGHLAPDLAVRDQVRELVAGAKNPSRVHYDRPDEMAAWLAQLLTPDEARRMREFLKLPPVIEPRPPLR